MVILTEEWRPTRCAIKAMAEAMYTFQRGAIGRKQASWLLILVREMFNIAPENAVVTVRSRSSKQHHYMPAMQEF